MEANKYPVRKRRSESFLGIHFDFHAGEDCTEVGKDVTREMVEHIVDEVKPDYIQCDCKGHRGFSSYPTKVGNPAPGFVKDGLRIWRDVTAEKGTALYLHYSGVWDTEALKHHPEWARIDENDEVDKNNTSVFGPYVDELLIPQLQELSDEYGVDGVWVDGECWATCQDYGEKVIEAFREQTGIQDIPRSPEDPYFFEYTEFCREGFRKYLEHYVEEMHKHNPDFQIASNWAYSSFMPEPANIDVDFISGDYTLQNSVNSARMEGRCMVHQGKPWDLMAWSFSAKFREGGASTKSVVQLQQEAAVVLALGGGFQAYFKQKRDGSINTWEMSTMAEAAKFCRERQETCHRAQPVPQVGLLYSSAAYYRKCRRIFSPWNGELTPMQGVLQNLLESQYSVEIVMEHHLEGRIDEYPIIVIPEWEYLEESFRLQLLEYVERGGNLLVIGPKAAALFEKEMDITLEGDVNRDAVQWLSYQDWMAGFKSPSQKVKLGARAKAIGKLYLQNDKIGSFETAASMTQYGKGKIAATYLNLGERYVNGATAAAREFLNGLVRELFPRPMVEVKGSHYVDVVVNQINGKLAVNLVNTAGPHANAQVYVFDEIPPIGPLDITIRSKERPSAVKLEPAGEDIAYEYVNEEIQLTLPKLDIHEIIVVE